MDNFENLHSDSRNLNVEWAMLKEMAQSGMPMRTEREISAEEAEKCQRRGKMLLKIINRMPDKLDDEEKMAKIDKVYQAAERAGIKDSLDKTLEFKREYIPHGRIGKETFGNGDVELTDEEKERVEELRERVVDLTEVEPGALAEEFPSGNYLYHGSTIPKIEKIFKTGGLKNGVALKEDDPETSAFDMNSGFEGISWNMDGIDAMPGSRGHIAGFLVAPEDVLGGGTHLVVPSRPAPYEVLQVSDKINPKELYAAKNQLETWGDGGATVAEKNNVDSNLVQMTLYKEGDIFFGNSKVYDYDGDLSDTELRKYYTLDDDGNLTWDEDIYQKSEVPPALPWMQSLIDRGVFARNELGELDTVQKVVERTREDRDFIYNLIATERESSRPIKESYNKMLDDAEAVRIGVNQMHFVVSHRDLDDWLKVMARTGVMPKSILLYDDSQVVLENFASQYDGNHKELGQEISRAVGANGDFWKNEMGLDPEVTPRSGYMGQVLLESAVRRDNVVRLGENGKVEVANL